MGDVKELEWLERAVKGVGRFQNGWSPPTPQPTAVSVERVEVGAELSRRRVMPLTVTQSVHSLDQHPSHSHSWPLSPGNSLFSWFVWYQPLVVGKAMIILLWKLKLNDQHREVSGLKEATAMSKARAGNIGMWSQRSRSTFLGSGTGACRGELVEM